jgi:2-polyprenyl-6-hydroxyphenyl methylase/3-demethylubiquinone-9 3-methyltransferase
MVISRCGPACKCCGRDTRPFGSIDASRSGQDRYGPVFPLSGRQVQYWRCLNCQFVFTTDFDSLSAAELAERIYNDDYIRADPDFAAHRPNCYAGFLDELLAPLRHRIEAIDFGGGRGVLANLAHQKGFDCYDSYDPYFGDQGRPMRQYDLVTAFEVVEHCRDPLGTFREMESLLKPRGAVMFSTSVQPKGVDSDWWYIAPRNGHVSIHSDRSLRILANRLGMHYLSVMDYLHLLYPTSGSWVARFIAGERVRAALRVASLRSGAALAATTMQLMKFGYVRPCLDPRHVARLLFGERRLHRT